MADMNFWSFDPDADPTYKKTVTDRLIQIKSQLTHTETQYSHRYGGISCSSTRADGCKCWRFKMIDYTKHPLRWKKVIIPCTNEQEDIMFAYDCDKADIQTPFHKWNMLSLAVGGCCYGPNALPYDTLGVVLCNISHRRIIPSWKNKAWCTEGRVMALLKAYPNLTDKNPDEFNPENGHKLIESLFVGANGKA